MVFTEKFILETSGKAFLLLLFLLASRAAPLPDSDEASLSDSADSSYSDDDLQRSSSELHDPLLARMLGLGNGIDRMDRSYGEIRPGYGGVNVGKRALSLFAHWKPQYRGVGGINTRSDVVSAVATRGGHARPLGQPLRWGK